MEKRKEKGTRKKKHTEMYSTKKQTHKKLHCKGTNIDDMSHTNKPINSINNKYNKWYCWIKKQSPH